MAILTMACAWLSSWPSSTVATKPRAALRTADTFAPRSCVATPTAETTAALHLVRVSGQGQG